MPKTVYIVDDSAAVRTALASLLRALKFDVEDFASARSFLDACCPERPGDWPSCAHGCLIVDVRMPDMSGIELQDELRRRKCHIPVIMLSGHASVPLAVRAMRGGAVSFLEKPVDEQELIDLINHCLNDQGCGNQRSISDDLAGKRVLLSTRQCEVFDLLMQGLQTKEVAARLGISPRTVEVHRAHILERLQAHSFTELIQGLLQPRLEH